MLEYYRVFAKQVNAFSPELQLSDFYHPSEDQKKNGKLLFAAVCTCQDTYALHKYLKQMTDEKKLYGVCYQPDRLWTGGKAIKELHKITSMSRKDVKSWLAKQALWQVHIPPPKETHQPQYNVTKPNEQHQFDLLYMRHIVFEGNTYKYILTGVDVASRYKVPRPLRTKKLSKITFVLEAIYKKGGVFKYPKVFQCDNGPEFKNEVTKLLEKHNVNI